MEAVTEKVDIERYLVYKDSGVEGLGEIPEHWNIEKGKWLFIKQDRPIRNNDDIITCFRDGQVTLRLNRKTEGFTNALKEHGYQGVRKGDLVIHNMDAFAGAIGVSDSDGKSTPVYSVCTPRKSEKVNCYYYAYFLRNLAKNGFIESLAKGIRERSTDFRFNDFGVLLLPVPPLEEQNVIVNFIDRKTVQIDKAIAQKEKLIELLKERRQILIHKAVTRGLDPTVRMKDSGVEWMGEIPEHWKVVKFKMLSEFINDGTHGSYPRVENGYRLLSVRNMIDDRFVFRDDDSRVSEKHFKEIRSKFDVQEGDIQLAIVGATLGKVAIVEKYDEPFVTQRSVCTIRIRRKLCRKRFIFYFIKSPSFQSYLWLNAGFSAQPGVYLGTIQNSSFPFPSLEEQDSIVDFLDEVSLKFEKAILIKEKEIVKLKEYKATLINAAVTGKIKVI